MAVYTNISDARQGAGKDDDDDVELRTKLQEMIQKIDDDESSSGAKNKPTDVRKEL